MAKGPISNVYITGGSSANGARYPARCESDSTHEYDRNQMFYSITS